MRIEMHLCDVCRTEVDPHWPLRLTADAQNSPTGEHLSMEFCSTSCLAQWLEDYTST